MNRTPALFLVLCSLLLWDIPGCDRRPVADSGFSDRRFAVLAAEVIRLHRRYADQPDSLTHQRQALFQRNNITPEDLERFVAERAQHPEAWEKVLQVMEGTLEEEEDTSKTGAGKIWGGRYRKGEGDSLRLKAP
jgi:hypothetical protein